MTKVTAQMSVSLDGYYAGPRSSTDPHDMAAWLTGPEGPGFFRVTRWVIDLEITGVGYRAAVGKTLQLYLGFSHDVDYPGPGRDHLRGAEADRNQDLRHRQAAGRRDRRRDPPHPSARALQGQGRALRRRGSAARKARRSKAHARLVHPRSAARPASAPPSSARANGRPRLSVFRSSKNIYAQVIDDSAGVTLAARLDARRSRADKTRTAPTRAPPPASASWSPSAPRKGRQGRRLRSRRLHLSRPGQGPGRRRARSRPELLRNA